ncbi:MAG TPA: amidohydrolase family protein [Bradyrhizobium sp.]|nr:amidohydrolase family protein [Bradyrhizobium sp.]
MNTLVDAHHHIWRQADLPWLTGPMQPRIFGPYEAIRRDYPIEEYLDDLRGCGVTQSVYVQTNWAKEQFEDEAAWVQRTADEHGFPHAIVAYADMDTDDVRPQLDRLARYKLLRGVRMQLHWHDNPLYRFAARPDLCADALIRANIARLADYGFSFDLQVFSGQMVDAAALAEHCPGVTFILQHAGMLEDLSPAGREAWRDGMQRLAACPNVVCKLSGLGTFIHRNEPAHIAGIVEETVAIFGSSRCLFGSNFPIEKLWTGYRDLVAAYQSALAGFDESERDAVLRTNAMRVYRLRQDVPATTV